ncbi:hypothetical protein XaplCFBP3122_11300 [Xanthomonas arboricola pv. populi]|uniref:Uncharacterized protein n=1 Tax=Xanthomonas arboricola pv. populi TaxID=487823 RepID=A0A2S6Z4B8_9XANT|nr:hypothetical protein [Xanthomonas arboricola]PPT76036.1 hypothetical protein XaplCFBP3122_11300 [Xanthomonas arboricola pv. populi]
MEQGKTNGTAMIALPVAGTVRAALHMFQPIHRLALKKSPGGLIPQAIGRVAAWATMEHDPNDR